MKKSQFQKHNIFSITLFLWYKRPLPPGLCSCRLPNATPAPHAPPQTVCQNSAVINTFMFWIEKTDGLRGEVNEDMYVKQVKKLRW